MGLAKRQISGRRVETNIWTVAVYCVISSLYFSHAWIPFFGEELHKHLNLESHHREWDLIQLLSINSSQTGVSPAKGPIPDTPAWRLRPLYDNIIVDPGTVGKIASTLHDEASFYFVYKQHKKTLATLLSINMPGKVKPFFQILSNLKSRKLQIYYHTKENTKIHQAAFKLPEKVGYTWSRILLSINQTQARIWVNCNHYGKQNLAGHIDLQVPKGALIYFRQEPGLKNKLIGSIQVGKVFNFGMQNRVWKCGYDEQFGPSWRPPLIG